MFAVVECGGKQYKVEKDSVISVEKLNATVGDKIDLTVVMVGDGANISTDGVVTAEVSKQDKAAKIIVFKYKAKKNERKKQGHRQPYTKLKVLSVEAK